MVDTSPEDQPSTDEGTDGLVTRTIRLSVDGLPRLRSLKVSSL